MIKGRNHMKTITKFIYPAFATIAFVCFALSPTAQAQLSPTPDGAYLGANTAEGGAGALFSLTSGTNNTALGSSALFSLTTGDQNTAVGAQALKNNRADQITAVGFQALVNNTTGVDNTATGWRALFRNTIGVENAAIGNQALYNNTTGFDNTAAGFQALFRNTTGNYNTAIGSQALRNNTTGLTNTATGLGALASNSTGDDNTATGFAALGANITGGGNTAIGAGALAFNDTGGGNTAVGDNALLNEFGGGNTAIGAGALELNIGNGNIALGSGAGGNLTLGSNNIYIGNGGLDGDSNTARIGDNVTKTFIAGISGTAVTGAAVVVNSSGQLGVAASSVRFKQQIEPMDKTSEAILALKPVTFRYKKELDPEGTPQFGLVTEDVEKVNPDLVARDADGKVYTVRYEAVNAMLLNEFLKDHRTVQEQQKEINALRAELKGQRALIQKVSDKVELEKPAPQTVLNNQ
jgi:hypothetical protein